MRTALTGVAEDALDLLFPLKRAWLAARAAAAGGATPGRRSVVDVLAAAPLVSATSLAAAPGLAPPHAVVRPPARRPTCWLSNCVGRQPSRTRL
jgi:hypothetical protein